METCEDTNVQQSTTKTPLVSPSFCLICGDLLNQVIKNELDVNTNDEIIENEFEEGRVSNIVTLIHEASPWSNDDSQMFQQFLKWFKVKPGNKLLWNSQYDYFPFCLDCKGKLVTLFEIRQKVNELSANLKCGIQEVRNKLESCENVFGVNNIYEKDLRYYEVRRQVVKVSTKPSNYPLSQPRPKKKRAIAVPESRKEADPEPEPTEACAIIPESKHGSGRSTRTRKSVVRYDYDLEDEDGNPQTFVPSTPIVLLSATDKINAEKHLNTSSAIKVEPDLEFSHLSQITKNSKPTRHTSGEVVKDNYTELSDNDCNNDWTLTENPLEMDTDFIAETGPSRKRKKTKKESGCTKKKTEERPKRKKKEKDVDFVMSEDSVSARSDDDDDMEDYVWDGGRKSDERVKFDADKGTYSCMNFVFDKVPCDGKFEQYKCRKCEQILIMITKNKGRKQINIKQHVVKEHTDRFVCGKCGQHEGSHGQLKKHMKFKHLGFSQYEYMKKNARPCVVCAKPIVVGRMRRHLWSHKNKEEREEAIAQGEKDPNGYNRDKKYQCEKCGKDFGLHNDWKRHTEVAHETEDEKEKRKELCPECGKVTLNLKDHIRSFHNKTRKIECAECNKKFVSWARLRRHKEVIHMNIRPFACTLCPRTFPLERNLQDHMKLHLNIRDWKCEHCDGAFIKKAHLEKHMNSFHVEGARAPRRKSYQRGPTQLKIGQRKKDLVETNTYCPPSYKSWWKPKPGSTDNGQEQDDQPSFSMN